ncbi:hypothetical protein KY290_027651 [Solanum tuberosum]|uniref:Uncharacterized protein n=1 Tax=Solanum tuberosum TaxID=4113 RepID=A0ABQ7UHD9_SOLTU|nr:hypothetical protein KY290_027651 [Solanum tuberosum]
MDEGFPSKRITSGSIVKYREIEEEKFIRELRSKKKTNPIALQQVINKAKASNIKIVEGENTRKVTDSDSNSNQSKQLMRLCLVH